MGIILKGPLELDADKLELAKERVTRVHELLRQVAHAEDENQVDAAYAELKQVAPEFNKYETAADSADFSELVDDFADTWHRCPYDEMESRTDPDDPAQQIVYAGTDIRIFHIMNSYGVLDLVGIR